VSLPFLLPVPAVRYGPRRALRLNLLALAFFVGLAFLTLYPIVFQTGTHVAGYDYFNYNWNFWWVRHAWHTPGLNVYLNDFVMFPALSNYGYHALTLFWYPLWALLEPLTGTLAAVTAVIFVGAVLNGYLLFALLRREGVSPGLALLGGAALQVFPIARYFYYNTHLNLMDWFWPPLLLLTWQQIARGIKQGRYGRALAWAAALGVGLWGVLLTDLQFPIFTAFLLGPYVLWTLWQGRQRALPLVAAGALALAIGVGLGWFAGPLSYIVRFEGQLVPGPVEDRPGVPFPQGFVSMAERWWSWDDPSVGAFATLAVIAALAAGWWARRGRVTLPARRWFWFAAMLPPLVFAMGPTLHAFGADIPLPFRLLYALTNGMFRMPWRLAPLFVIAAMVFVGLALTPLLRRWRLAPRLFALVGAFLALALSVRLFETGPLDPVLPHLAFYDAMGAEQGPPYDDYVVVEAPTGAGTGEVLLGNAAAIQYQWYGIFHHKRMVNGFISRAPIDNFWYIVSDDPLLSWLGQRRPLEPEAVERQLRERVYNWPIGYIVVHQDLIGREGPTTQEIIGYFNSLPDLLCPVWVEGDAVAYRTAWHPDGCPPRTPPEVEPGVYAIDVGAAGDERHIGWGWHWPETVSGITWRWAGEYPQARVYVDLPPGAYRLTLTMQAFWEPRRVAVLVNGVEVGAVTTPTDTLRAHTFDVPAAAVGSGQHVEIVLDYDTVVVPAEVGQSADPRRLAVAVDTLRFARQGE